MRIGGFQKISLIDYPGRISAIVFTQGCNFRCPYCHNPELVDPAQYGPILPETEVLSFLEKRRGKLEAVTVTGGEPTLQKDLERFLQQIKKMGYLVKVDTNGSKPTMLERLIRGRWVDYLAMDVKGPLHKYGQIAKADVETAKILRSIELIASSGIEHEFRTTVVRSQLDKEDLIATARMLKKAQLYVLQPFMPKKTLDNQFLSELSYSTEEFAAIQKKLESKRLRIIIR
ncbi:MAG: anaerobic ribonucleoside-triphosphate reductase activating protein [Syntrophales bacterium]|nr:anaerobic ribonucleoside-triphosphate reductase activating protein [Syntrophales bacterium]